MTRGSEGRYIHYYTDGSAARQPEPKPARVHRKKVPKPRMQHQRVVLVRLDPLALGGLAIVTVLAVMMLVSAVRLSAAVGEKRQLENDVSRLRTENAELDQTYRDGFDLDEIYEKAIAGGMIPISQAEAHPLFVGPPDEEMPAPESFWEKMCGFFEDLFA